jgi:hypothetical protein
LCLPVPGSGELSVKSEMDRAPAVGGRWMALGLDGSL